MSGSTIAEHCEKHFGELLDYVHHHGDARVPRSYTTRTGTGSVRGLDQRNRFAWGVLDADRSLRLEQLPSCTWDPRSNRPNVKTTTPEAT